MDRKKKKRKKKEPGFTVVIDTQEQLPYYFKKSIRKKIKTGDYSIEGLENIITIERKTKSDIYQSLGKERPRFKREAIRMVGFEYAAIVIECNLKDLTEPPPFVEKMTGKKVINALISWSIKYRIHVFFASDRLHGQAITYRILEKFWKYWSKK